MRTARDPQRARGTVRLARVAAFVAGGVLVAALGYEVARSQRTGLDRRVAGRTAGDWARALSAPAPGAPADTSARRQAATALARLLQPGTPSDTVAARVATYASAPP